MRTPQRLRWLLRRRQLKREIAALDIHLTAVSDEDCRFGAHVRIGAGVKFHHSTIGDFSYASAGSRVAYSDIGKFVSIGPEVMLGGLGKHPTDFFSTHPYFYSKSYRARLGLAGGAEFEELPRTTVGNDVWIGARAMILDGVTIGDGAIVAANAIVTADVEPYAIVGGVPAKLLRRRRMTPEALGERPDWWNLSLAEREALFARVIGRFDAAAPDVAK